LKHIKRISSIGLGAIGCAYNSKIYDMNPDGLKVIAGGERLERYKRDGFLINGKHYDFTYIDPKEKCEPADLVIISVKANQLKQAVKDIKNHVGKDTIIISLLNGITSEEIIGKEYGMDKILYSMCIAIDGTRRGNEIRFSSYGNIAFGEKINKTYSEKVKSVKDLFDRAGIEYEIPENMIKTMWYKFMVNVGINQTSAVLGGTYGLFQKNIYARNFMDSAMEEVIKLSQKASVNLDKSDIEKWHKVLDSMPEDSGTSMYQDIKYGRETEVDIFAGTVCKLGKKYGVETPVNNTLLNIIKVIEKTKVLSSL
jgi:2-dehydropantoate 2-reductase